MDKHKTIIIHGVNTNLLNEQRLTLGDSLEGMNKEGLFLNNKQAEALIGVVNMLNGWYDEFSPPK